MSAITIWAGPVNHTQNGDLRWPGTEAVYVTCTGDGSGGTPRCAEQATARPMSSVAGDASEIYGGAFSAGGQYWERVLTDDRIRGLYLADGTYSMWNASGKRPEIATMKNRIDFAVKAAGDSRFRAVYTSSSSPNGTSPSGSQTLEALADEVSKRAPLKVGERSFVIAGKNVTAKSWEAGGVLLLDFGSAFTHTQMTTVVAPALWPVLFSSDSNGGAGDQGDGEGFMVKHAGKIMIGIGILATLGVGIAAISEKKEEQ